MYRTIINEIQQEKSLFKPKYNNNLSDTEGLNKAYTNGKGFFIDGNKLYVAGTFGKSNIKSREGDPLSVGIFHVKRVFFRIGELCAVMCVYIL